MSSGKAKGIPPPSKIPASGHDSGTHSRSSSVSNLTSASDLQSEAGDAPGDSFNGFKLEDKIYVNGNKPGIIKFLGKTEFAAGAWAGILLEEPVGKNNGTVAGVTYFTCKPLYGIFARPQKLTRTPGPLADALGSRASSPRGSTTGSIRCTTPSVRSLALTPGSSRPCSRLKIGERVVVSSATGTKNGVVRFIGETEFAKGDWAGIELDEPLGKNDGSVAGKRYFSCEMKHGLFSPLHKVSRAGGTATPRTPSVRGTPLRRSNSRDSISSSVSNCSRSSKVKLGITSLSNTQPKTNRVGKGLITTSSALQEAIKEKEHHIEQLLKEQDLERNEVARITALWEEAEAKYEKLQSVIYTSQALKKTLEEQLSDDRRKLEDAQFLLEEEKIIKSDLETQLGNQSKILNRLQDFISQNSDVKALNVKEILEGKDILSPVSVCITADPELEILKKRCLDLETEINKLTEEKTESLKGLDVLNVQLKETQVKNDSLLNSLNSTIQEKEDAITSLKNELNTAMQTLATVQQENADLGEKIKIQAAEAKGQTDSIVQEKLKSITDDLNSKNILLQSFETKVQEKDSQIDFLSKNLADEASKFAELTNQLQSLHKSLEEKNVEMDKKLALESQLNQEVERLKNEVSFIPAKEEKILDLVKKIESLSNSIQEKDEHLSQKTNAVSQLSDEIDSLRKENETLQAQMKEANQKTCDDKAEKDQRLKVLDDELKKAESDKNELILKFEKETKELKEQVDALSREIKEKETCLSENISQLSLLNQSVDEKDAEFAENEKELQLLKQTLDSLTNEKATILESLQSKDQSITQLKEEVATIQSKVDEGNLRLSEVNSRVDTLQQNLKEKSDENAQLLSKLQVAEQKVEMLNKDSSEHVMSLQKELSKLKEDNLSLKSAHEKEISAAQAEIANFSAQLNEKIAALKENQERLDRLSEELQNKENTISNMSSEFKKASSDLSSLSNEKLEIIAAHEKTLQVTKDDLTSQLNTKELKIAQLQAETEKMAQAIAEKNSTLEERNTAIDSLKEIAQSKDNEIVDLKAKLEALGKDFSVLSNTKETSEKELQTTLEAIKIISDERERTIELLEKHISEYKEQLCTKEAEITDNKAEITTLKSTVQQKDLEFNELTKTAQVTQEDLKKLNDLNAQNESLLKSKEGFLTNFTQESERKISDLEEKLKQEAQSYKDIISKHEKEIKDKEKTIQKLNSEAEKHVNEIEVISKDLSLAKELNVKTAQDSSDAYRTLTEKVAELESKCSQLTEIKNKLEAEQLQAQDAKANLELARDSLLQEKAQQEESIKVRESKLAQLQADVTRMQQEFAEHKKDLESKLKVSEEEKQAALEFKTALDLQTTVTENVQKSLLESEEKNKTLEVQIQQMSLLVSAKDKQLQKLDTLEAEANEKSTDLKIWSEKCNSLQELLEKKESKLKEKDLECLSLVEKISSLNSIKESDEHLKKKIKVLEQEHLMLKMQNEKLEKIQAGNKIVASSELNANQPNAEEMESLTMQIDFLNSIIVDMKQKNEKLEQENEILKMGPADTDTDTNYNDVPKKLAPRLFCDICDMFDLHDTDDCPKQESCFPQDSEEVPNLVLQGTRKLEERPYCSICEEFGHWTQDCTEQDEY